MRARGDFGSMHCLLRHLQKHFIHQRTFATARDAADANQAAEWKCNINIFKVVLTGAFDHDRFRLAHFAPRAGNLHATSAAQIHAGQTRGMRGDFRGSSVRHNFSTMSARAWTNVHHKIGGSNCVLIVLHHDHGVANISEFTQGFYQSVIVALVQANGWLI